MFIVTVPSSFHLYNEKDINMNKTLSLLSLIVAVNYMYYVCDINNRYHRYHEE